jgi:hypothetical protein
MEDEAVELSDVEFLKWAGVHPERWALLPSEKRESWLAHLVARMNTSTNPRQRRAYWQLASVIASADGPRRAEGAAPNEWGSLSS